MAIARGAGTEIIRCVCQRDINTDSPYHLIYGEQHHVYTVLSVIIYCHAIATTGNVVYMTIKGYNAQDGLTQEDCYLMKQSFSVAGETFVWDNKFSFNGTEPTDFTGPLDSLAKQDAIADQASSAVQKLDIWSQASGDHFQVTCTYLDQNNE